MNKQFTTPLLIEPRAGLVPFFKDEDGTILYLTMVSSDPRFGGPRPMISKGKIEDGEDSFGAAVREAEEELGFKKSNAAGKAFLVDSLHVYLRSAQYNLDVYAVEVMSKFDFTPWGEETKNTEWLSLEQFKVVGRHDHIAHLEKIESMVTQK